MSGRRQGAGRLKATYGSWRRAAPWVASVLVGCLCVRGARAHAEQGDRAGQLVRLLANSDFRVRTQAAFSLGRVDDPSVTPHLLGALSDPHPAVRAAAAVSLGRIGDPSALPVLRGHNDAQSAVQSQVARAIAMIEQRAPSGTATVSWPEARYYLELGQVANTSKTSRPTLLKEMRTVVLTEMRRVPSAVVSETAEPPEKMRSKLARNKVTGYQVSASLGRLVRYMSTTSVKVRAEVSLAVANYPDYTYCLTVNGSQSVSQSRSSFNEAQVPELQKEAVSGAFHEAFGALKRALESGQADRCRGGASPTRARAAQGRRTAAR